MRATLVGDGIETPGNAVAMVHAAAMFGAACRFRDRGMLARSAEFTSACGAEFPGITSGRVAVLHPRRVAFDNLPGAAELYGFRPGPDFAVMVGNERRGLSRECREIATHAVQVPMHSRRVNCLNVAAASAVALYYMLRPTIGPMARRGNPAGRRPELLLLGAGDHVELGSSIRSAAAFGWTRALLEDRRGVWFGTDRGTRSEGRAAARRGKNDIRLVPTSAEATGNFRTVTVITTRRLGIPLHRANLAGGPGQLIVLPDEGSLDVEAEDWQRLGRDVGFASLDLPGTASAYHYRLGASVALAEVARQVGVRSSRDRAVRGRTPRYDSALAALADDRGEVVRWSELITY